MKIPKQSKPVRRAGFMNRLKVKTSNKVTPSMIDDEPDGGAPDTDYEGEGNDSDEGEVNDTDETSEESFEGNNDEGADNDPGI